MVKLTEDEIAERFLAVLERNRLLTSAWTGVSFLDMPEEVKKAVKDCMEEFGLEPE
jgi:hypothetical protein